MTWPRFVRRAWHYVRLAWRWYSPSPEIRAWRHACRLAETTPRFTQGTIRMMDYALQYGDLLSLCPQWEDIFIDRSLAFRSTVRAPRILDCGANIGLSALFYKRLYPDAVITAFEADPVIAAQLRHNLQVNGAGDVEVVAAAVWTENGEVEFVAEGADGGTLAGMGHRPRGESVRVPSCRLADLLQREPITFLKLDIEGAETAVLRDAAPYLGNVQALLLEVHEFELRQRRLPEILTLLSGAGFCYTVTRVTQLSDLNDKHRRPDHPFPQWADGWIAAVCAWRPGD